MSADRRTSRAALQTMVVIKQGLHQRPEQSDRGALREIIRRIGLLQLDSISVTARSHYLVMLSRAGLYDVDELDSLLDEGDLFEYWAHAACLIPMEHYAYFAPRMQERRADPPSEWVERRMGENAGEIIAEVLQTIREQGAMSSAEFEDPRGQRGTWWDWKPAKAALEYLYDRGELMVSKRVNFRRYYDLAERVLHGRHNGTVHTMADWYRWATVAGLRHLGAGTAHDIADYYRLPVQVARRELVMMAQSDEVLPLVVEGWHDNAFIHKDDLPLLEMVEDGKYNLELTCFLSPFDNLIWHRDRTEGLFDFYYRVEMYTPAPKRQYGYYVMPILHRGALVGRIDPKIERKARRFEIRALHLEDGVQPDESLIAGLQAAIREFMAFHNCDDFDLLSAPDEGFKRALLKGLQGA